RSKVQDKKDLEVFNQIKDKYLINMLEKDQVKEELRLNYQAVVDKDIFEANLSQTVEDQAVGILFRNLKTSDKYDSLELDDATKKSLKDHKISMAAENFLGEFLERYLKEKLEQHSWHWCCNSLVNAVDFIKENDDETFVLLQVKNSSNTENSSSSKVRVNTTIKKWYRRKASNGQVCWDKFPDKDAIQDLSEESFLQWISELNISVKDTE
ncbi:MAG: SinI family restriction endonuclease, partial [Acinetobacter sp.]|nr:SinI family restriction endonuclease [Acinetobacter sp.]